MTPEEASVESCQLFRSWHFAVPGLRSSEKETVQSENTSGECNLVGPTSPV